MGHISIGNKKIGAGLPVFIIAEAGVNHDGDISKAKLLVDIAVQAGADAVKFQTWKTEKLLLKKVQKAAYQKAQTGEGNQYDMVKALEISYDKFQELKRYCERKGILFLSTPDEQESADFLNNIGVPAFKIGSGELNNLLYIKHVACFGKPMIVSTGMGTMAEVLAAQKTIQSVGNEQLVFLHCTTDYPAQLKDVNLRAMASINEKCNTLVGYSDHTTGSDVAVLAVWLGACVIEKHITYDKNAQGPDHKASLDPQELAEFVKRIRTFEQMSKEEKKQAVDQIKNAESILGSAEKKPTKREQANMPLLRKSLLICRDLPAGKIITENLLVAKRAGGAGIPASEYQKIIGKKTRHALKEDHCITNEDLL